MQRFAAILAALILLAGCTENAVPAISGSGFGGAAADLVSQAGSSGPPVVAGCQMFPAPGSTPAGEDWWNVDVSNYPLDPKSGTYVASLPGNLHPDFGHEAYYGIPFNVVPANQPKVPVHFVNYPSSSNPGPYPIPPDAQVEGQPLYHSGDRHLLVLQQGTCTLYEMWEAVEEDGGKYWNAANGAVFHLDSSKLRPAGWTSADAAGLPITPALIKCAEVQAGAIHHALRVTFQHTYWGYIHPATHEAGESDASLPPMGARFRLSAMYDISKFNRVSQIVLTAMKHYGMFVADNGTNWYVQGQGGTAASCWNDDRLDQLKTVPGSAFEVVDTGPILGIGGR
ncbi:MAG TPA: hypothetical protein VMF61_04520 [Candidatus Acidoferrales bacterium]|nr:hypothetical protein [Candidatus Acidoferrales bacterium]